MFTVLAGATADLGGDIMMEQKAGRPCHADAEHAAVRVTARPHRKLSGALADQPRSPPNLTPPHPPLTETRVVDASAAATTPDARRGSAGCYRRCTVPRQTDWRATAELRGRPLTSPAAPTDSQCTGGR